jgi:hypothetical protein
VRRAGLPIRSPLGQARGSRTRAEGSWQKLRRSVCRDSSLVQPFAQARWRTRGTCKSSSPERVACPMPIVAHQIDPNEPGSNRCQRFDRLPAGVPATIVDQDNLKRLPRSLKDGKQASHQRTQTIGAVVDGYHNADTARVGLHTRRLTRIHRSAGSRITAYDVVIPCPP